MNRALQCTNNLLFLVLWTVLIWASGASVLLAGPPQDTEIDNARVVEMTKIGLGDEIIIAKIKTAHPNFSLSDNDLVELKRANVSDRVIAAMLEASVLKNARVKIDGNPVEIHTLGQSKVGGRLGRTISLGIKSVKTKAYLQGQHAPVIVSRNPTIEIELPPNSSIDNYIVVQMDGKGDRRELEVGAGGGAVGAKHGLRAESVVRTSYDPLGGRRYKMSTLGGLKGGEYILYVIGSADYDKGIYGLGYDFTVE
jgi:hypothetical protein